ncbi:MAG: cytochrome c oxidase subunit 3 family protein [candidate division Zixibacteria bacterium]|jgi:cytochrome c oxidase subunit 3|nr:cytochrome c oxidase subunit 3 family protein [candidate division Zixibacteria bacterium]
MSSTHAGSHPKYLQHHFGTAVQQEESSKLGMWVFLLTEVLFFGGLFCAYAVFNAWYPETFVNAHKSLSWQLGAVNTIVLITSSVTIALAIRSMQLGRKKATFRLLLATVLLAAVFLVVKYFEYSHKIHLGQLPGNLYTYTGIEGTNPHIFFSVYFMLTGLHGVHVVAGIIAISWMMYRVSRDEFSAEYYTPIELTGLYWHLVDLVWIFLFPMLYLIG